MSRWQAKLARLLTLLWRESLELRRDRFTLGVLFLMPVMQLDVVLLHYYNRLRSPALGCPGSVPDPSQSSFAVGH